MSQEKFGEAIYNSRQTISKWERGESAPTSENIELICKKFNVSSEEIYGKHTELKNDLSKKFN